VKAEVLTIGDEVLRGEIVDSNKAFLSERLLSLDIETHYHASVRDIPVDMIDALRRAASRADVVLVSGGLGPTRDDLTAEALAEAFDRPLRLDENALAGIRAFFASVGREMTDNNASQARFPEGAEVLPNPIGTAPGFALQVEAALFFCLPGVPREMMRMVDEQVLPRIARRQPDAGAVRARLLRTFGMGESTLDAELADVADSGAVTLGFRTSFPDNYLRPVARAATAAEAEALLDRVCAVIRQRLGPLVYGEGDETLEQVAGRLLRERGARVAVAESCTGGLIAEKLTDVPGSSAYFLGGVVAYADEAKRTLLGVPQALLERHGAVSEPVARAMAEGVRERFGAEIGVATTGISGPDGGSDAKPVGLVHLALADAEGTHADQFVFPLDRTRHRQITAQVALDWIRRRMLGFDLEGPSLLRRRGGASAPGGRAARAGGRP
jgi:competence/damage-inducible protein CinA-like protein